MAGTLSCHLIELIIDSFLEPILVYQQANSLYDLVIPRAIVRWPAVAHLCARIQVHTSLNAYLRTLYFYRAYTRT